MRKTSEDGHLFTRFHVAVVSLFKMLVSHSDRSAGSTPYLSLLCTAEL